ncbi:MAG: carboxynorspermidine decarboxylase [Clostridiales bacterium]|jgi:carboxynorspermidine decarboxylase|nr:carboxynorspermidine decarboxylase [Clostridiales bacterium]
MLYTDNDLQTPFYIIDESLVKKNLEILKYVKDETGCKILLAQKAFSMFSMYPLLAKYLDGTTASGLFEAKLGHGYFKKENHIFSPAYQSHEFDEVASICSHIVFNSFAQLKKFRHRLKNNSVGVRVNPEASTQGKAIYDPCSEGSRLGVTIDNFDCSEPIDGIHFHTLCEQNSDALAVTLKAVEGKFSKYFKNIKWLNFGGGHHITREGYDLGLLISEIRRVKEKYNVEVILEPGEAVVLNAGFLVSSVLDIVRNGIDIAILDTSAACHMPDVLEVPYRPIVIGSAGQGVKKYSFRLGGPTCLAGDIIGDYSFDEKIVPGDKLVFCDMALYTMVKNNTFNGMNLPSIAVLSENREINLVKSFGYDDFKSRLS